ncbi:hypothetical protein PPIS_a2021 [Pseudoalteromonas piscicida]|uniref:Uncharacterized protein n=1 Tax=Pseudoalteromonas piscicida TaxID=43662 RepID=A0ABM6NDM0_PSEO7|nr:hypothetical protein PPIS_a2021 [Pseudoalteromonas piscicida]
MTEMSQPLITEEMAARQKFCYLVVLNEKFLTTLICYFILQID